ncbi:MAG: AAA family ATPase, partial [Chloroflexi bacterium]|nr:AAA family ATPase [Chloroflexota bacterium]
DYEGRLQVLRMNFQGKPLAPDVSLEEAARRTEGYSGADLRAVAHASTILAFREAIQGNAQQVITVAHVERALERQRPSIQPQVLARFERWKAEHGE